MFKILNSLKIKLLKKLILSINEESFWVSENILILKNTLPYNEGIVENTTTLVLDKTTKKHIHTSHITYAQSYLLLRDPTEYYGLINNTHLAVIFKDKKTQEDKSCIQTEHHILLKGYKDQKNGILENDAILAIDKRLENNDVLSSKVWEKINSFFMPKSYQYIYNQKIVQKHLIKSFMDEVEYDQQDKILDPYIQDNCFIYRNFKMKFLDKRSMWILMHELLVLEEYFFETKNLKPYIIDCGVNFGLALLYFKDLYPECSILGFEPMPEVYQVAEKNIEINQLQNIQILPYALAGNEKKEKFFISETDSMAGTLCNIGTNNTKTIEVECKTLSRYLNQKVDFLKLDIEGAEEEVLKEAQNKLKNVHYLFCEYHFSSETSNSLAEILRILSEEGFIYQVDKSWGYKNKTSERPFKYIGNKYSALIFAKNQHYEERE